MEDAENTLRQDPTCPCCGQPMKAEAMWINHQFTAECSECHKHVEYVGKGRYCSNCGRKMTAEKSDWNDTIYSYPPKVN